MLNLLDPEYKAHCGVGGHAADDRQQQSHDARKHVAVQRQTIRRRNQAYFSHDDAGAQHPAREFNQAGDLHAAELPAQYHKEDQKTDDAGDRCGERQAAQLHREHKDGVQDDIEHQRDRGDHCRCDGVLDGKIAALQDPRRSVSKQPDTVEQQRARGDLAGIRIEPAALEEAGYDGPGKHHEPQRSRHHDEDDRSQAEEKRFLELRMISDGCLTGQSGEYCLRKRITENPQRELDKPV